MKRPISSPVPSCKPHSIAAADSPAATPINMASNKGRARRQANSVVSEISWDTFASGPKRSLVFRGVTGKFCYTQPQRQDHPGRFRVMQPIRRTLETHLRVAAIGVIGLIGGAPGPAAERWSSPQDVEFRSAADDSAQRYVQLLPEPFDPAKEAHLLVVLHGHGSDRWQYVRQDRGECRGRRDVALKHGMIFLSPDYRARFVDGAGRRGGPGSDPARGTRAAGSAKSCSEAARWAAPAR